MNGIPLQGILVPIRKWRNRNSFAPTRVPVVLFVFFSFLFSRSGSGYHAVTGDTLSHPGASFNANYELAKQSGLLLCTPFVLFDRCLPTHSIVFGGHQTYEPFVDRSNAIQFRLIDACHPTGISFHFGWPSSFILLPDFDARCVASWKTSLNCYVICFLFSFLVLFFSNCWHSLE